MTGPGETNPQVPLRERIARAINDTHFAASQPNSPSILGGGSYLRELYVDAVLAEVQTELDKFSALQDKCQALVEKWKAPGQTCDCRYAADWADCESPGKCADELRELLG